MGMDELILMKYGELYREVIIEEVREQVIGEVRDSFIEREKNALKRSVFRLLKKGFSVEQIVDLLDIPQPQVEDFLDFSEEQETKRT
jgi:Mg2+/Co2+ transporter CorC